MWNFKINRSVAALVAAGLTLAAASTAGAATTVLSDNFDSYNNADLSGQGGWTATQAVTGHMQVAGAADKYVQFATSGQDEFKGFTSIVPHTDGESLTTSFNLNVSAAQTNGDYFAHLSNPLATTSNFYQRLFARSSGTGYQLGLLGASGGTPSYGATVLNFNQEYDIDLTWNFVAGTLNDTFALNVDNVPYHTYTWDALSAAEPANLAAANLRQGAAGNSATLQLDDLTVSASAIPEPASIGLLATAGAFLLGRRRKH